MKILLIDNHTDYLHNFTELFLNHNVEVQEYKPGLDFHLAGKDLVVLSGGGGEGFELKDLYKKGKLWYEDEMNFVLSCDKPLIGICMGFEVVSAAFGSDVQHIGQLISGFKTHKTSDKGKIHFNHEKLRQYEHHRFAIPDVSSKHFEVLADSDTGIEMIRHKNRKIIASQFHPEVKGGSLSFTNLLTSLAV